MVYITSDLFGPDTSYGHENPSNSSYWPTMASPQHAAGLGKRKRQGEDVATTTCVHQHRMHPSGRESARSQFHNTPPFEANGNHSYAVYPITQQHNTAERRPVKQLKRINPKAMLVKSTSHLMDIDLESQHSHTQSHPVSDLRPCHACKSAPKRKRDLENYLDCKRCDGRTCYICARQCVGGCGKAICKKCIVEVGEEGDSWCLDCYARNLNS
ncbi:hypothetical protein T440DRAFT_430414 [Plenodomus tracheiphilus IPT5]|uniref:Uncharacterized protein n=1 Tax=Plenodomus tracheiphilus IPT5 TaxID=1408161 RepID=A0A6A7AWH0_9PLEO|nr:hypothetical protein T440DRAFT_430414 [Plenodomus tracheiphilus IPT5]